MSRTPKCLSLEESAQLDATLAYLRNYYTPRHSHVQTPSLGSRRRESTSTSILHNIRSFLSSLNPFSTSIRNYNVNDNSSIMTQEIIVDDDWVKIQLYDSSSDDDPEVDELLEKAADELAANLNLPSPPVS
tara:strand:+ start:285 stop:677 length:393 start_codon:yes stop_codon:yes gene_type:complete